MLAGANPGHDTHGRVHPVTSDRDKHWYQTGMLLSGARGMKLLVPPDIAFYGFVVSCIFSVAPVALRAPNVLRAGVPRRIDA